jgi:hypothetical protein
VHWPLRVRRDSRLAETEWGRPESEVVERAAPGVAALFDGIGEDRSHSVLDLGTAADTSLRVYGRFARRIRFVDLVGNSRSSAAWAETLTSLPEQAEQPYDLLFAWDILDRLFAEERPGFVAHLRKVSAPDARLHLVVDNSQGATTQPRRFTLTDVDRMSCAPAGPSRPARRRLLPGEVERVLAPFRVVRGFTLKGGLREYVAVRTG